MVKPYSHFVRCLGTTKEGKRCGVWGVDSSLLCDVHRNQDIGEARIRRERAAVEREEKLEAKRRKLIAQRLAQLNDKGPPDD